MSVRIESAMSGQQQTTAAAGTPATPATEARLHRAAEEFVGVAFSELLGPMFSGLDATGGIFGGGVGEATFRPMLINEMAKSLAHSGGLGLTAKVEQAMRALERTARDASAGPVGTGTSGTRTSGAGTSGAGTSGKATGARGPGGNGKIGRVV